MATPRRLACWLTLMALLASCAFVWSCAGLMGMEGLALSLCILAAPTFLVLAFKQQKGFTLAELLVVIAISLILLALLKPVRSEAIGVRRMRECASQSEAIAQAIHAYEDDHGCLPPAHVCDKEGRPMHSWRVLILPYLGYRSLCARYRFDEPWNGPNNSKLLESMPKEYACPLRGGRSRKDGVTTYVAVVGAETTWPDDRPARCEDIRDGADRTIMVGEVSPTLRVKWLEPRDVSFKDAAAGLNHRPYNDDATRGRERERFVVGHYGFALVTMADGSVRGLSEDTTPDTLRALLTASGGEAVDIDAVASKPLNPPGWFSNIDRMTALALLAGSLLAVIVLLGWYSQIMAARRKGSSESPEACATNNKKNPSGTA